MEVVTTMPRFDFYVHGLWILGAIFFFIGAIIAGNLRWVEGTTEASFALAILLSFSLFAIAGLMWISAGTNAAIDRTEEPWGQRQEVREVKDEVAEMKEAMKEEETATPRKENGEKRLIRKIEKDIEEIKEVMREEER